MNKIFNLGQVHKDICNGYSEIAHPNSKYYKHLSPLEISCVDDYYQEMVSLYKDKGALAEKELLDLKIKTGEWSADKEEKINFILKNISLMSEKRKKAAIPSQMESIDEVIDTYKKDCSKLESEKSNLLRLSAESLALSAKIEYIIHLSFFDDANCSKNSFSLDNAINFSIDELVELLEIHKKINERISLQNIKKVSIRNYIRDSIKHSLGIESFFGKKGYELTVPQIYLFDYAKYFQKILENIDHSYIEDNEDPNSIEDAYIFYINKDKVKEGAERSDLVNKFNEGLNFGK